MRTEEGQSKDDLFSSASALPSTARPLLRPRTSMEGSHAGGELYKGEDLYSRGGLHTTDVQRMEEDSYISQGRYTGSGMNMEGDAHMEQGSHSGRDASVRLGNVQLTAGEGTPEEGQALLKGVEFDGKDAERGWRGSKRSDGDARRLVLEIFMRVLCVCLLQEESTIRCC